MTVAEWLHREGITAPEFIMSPAEIRCAIMAKRLVLPVSLDQQLLRLEEFESDLDVRRQQFLETSL